MARARSARCAWRARCEARPGRPTTRSTRCARRPRRRCAMRSGELLEPTPRTRASAASGPSSGPIPGSSTSACAATRSELAERADARPAPIRRRHGATQVRRRRRRGHGPPHGAGRAHRRARRGRAPAAGRHERRDEGTGRASSPSRVLGTPISENAFVGLGGGLALDGRFRPVVEFMYPDFMWVAADQVFNQIGKARHMFGGDNPVPLVLRTKVAMGSGYGSQHLMDPAGIFATSPGWRIVAPVDRRRLRRPDERRARAAGSGARHRARRPVRPSRRGARRRPRLPVIPPGKAAMRREGVGRDGHQLSVDGAPLRSRRSSRPASTPSVIDLRWLDRASLDWETIGEHPSRRRTPC